MTQIDAERRLDLDALRTTINRKLERYLPDSGDEPPELVEAMSYSLMAGGKRLRPMVVCAAHHACGGVPDEHLWQTAAAIEYLHTFSLVHDDLPCMDDDDLRRGQPTCHKRFGEGVAVLAGDALAVRGFELLAGTGQPELVSEVAQAIGAAGMIGGQVADLEAEGQDVSLEVVRGIHRRKTAVLFRASAKVGGMLTHAPDLTLQALATFGENLGVAFQIVDDLLDLEGETERLGKRTGADIRRGKATYPGASSVEAARKAATSAAQVAEDALATLRDSEALATLLDSAVRREG